MSNGGADPISLFRFHVKNRRFDEAALRALESILVSKDLGSLLEVRLILREFLRSESLDAIREIAGKRVEQKLLVLDFFVRAFALAGDFESCLAIRYEALLLRELHSASYQELQVSYREWMTFAEHSLDKGFYSITRMACENALSSFMTYEIVRLETESFKKEQIIKEIKGLKDLAVASVASLSVQAQAAAYLKKRTGRSTKHVPLDKETSCSVSTLFRNGIKRRNARRLRQSKSLQAADYQ